jgi:hypothetical protein
MNRKIYIKRVVVILTVIGVLCAAFVWLFTHSYIDFTFTNRKDGDLQFSITDPISPKHSISKNVGSNSIKLLVSRGVHQAEFTQNGTSYVVLVKSAGFLGTTKILVSLSPEKSRQFIGDNPGDCMQLVNGILTTSTCGGEYTDIKTHIPATTTSATSTQHDVIDAGSFEGFAALTTGSYVLVKQYIGDENTSLHELYKQVSTSGATTITDPIILTGLSADKRYNVKIFKDGIVVYSDNLSEINLYPDLTKKPTVINPDKLLSSSLSPVALSTSKNAITLLYSNYVDIEKIGVNKIASEIIVLQDSDMKHYSFKKNYISATICGARLLCAVGDSRMDVYDITNKPKLLYSLSNVSSVDNTGSKLVVATKSGLLDFNIETRTGSYLYSFGKYTLGNLQSVGQNYLVSIKGVKNKRYALYIDTTLNSTDFMDKKYYELLNIPQLAAASLYKNILFITPQTGTPSYDDATGFFGYDQLTKKSSNNSINDAIIKLGIDTKLYKIINTAP